MWGADSIRSRAIGPTAVLISTFFLSGCVAAAIPLVLAEGGALGFEGFKLFQTGTGGAIRVGFPGKDGKEAPPQPLPNVRRVAVWPHDEGNVRFAEKLAESGKFEVTPPAKVSVILSDAKITADLKTLTEQEQVEAYDTVCRATNADLVFASRALGASAETNAFSFSRGNISSKADLFAYSCSKKSIVWRDQIAMIIEVGDKIPSEGEQAQAAGDAWADRILQSPAA